MRPRTVASLPGPLAPPPSLPCQAYQEFLSSSAGKAGSAAFAPALRHYCFPLPTSDWRISARPSLDSHMDNSVLLLLLRSRPNLTRPFQKSVMPGPLSGGTPNDTGLYDRPAPGKNAALSCLQVFHRDEYSPHRRHLALYRKVNVSATDGMSSSPATPTIALSAWDSSLSTIALATSSLSGGSHSRRPVMTGYPEAVNTFVCYSLQKERALVAA